MRVVGSPATLLCLQLLFRPQPGGKLAGESFGNPSYTKRLDGSDHRQLTTSPALDSEPAWSPDGRSLAFSGERGLHIGVFIFDTATGALREMNPNFNGGQLPAWSPDGRAIITGATTAATLRIVPIDGTQPVFVSGRPAGEFGPDWTTHAGQEQRPAALPTHRRSASLRRVPL